jgi:hypothetical protein
LTQLQWPSQQAEANTRYQQVQVLLGEGQDNTSANIKKQFLFFNFYLTKRNK